MSQSALKSRTADSQVTRLSPPRIAFAIAMLALAVGGGAYFWMNHSTAKDDSVVQHEADEFAPLELDDPSGSGDEPGRLESTGISDVVSAVHRAPSDEQSWIQQTGSGISSRPPSNPAAWLDGTIEAEPAVEPAPWPYPAAGASRPHTFDRYSRR